MKNNIYEMRRRVRKEMSRSGSENPFVTPVGVDCDEKDIFDLNDNESIENIAQNSSLMDLFEKSFNEYSETDFVFAVLLCRCDKENVFYDISEVLKNFLELFPNSDYAYYFNYLELRSKNRFKESVNILKAGYRKATFPVRCARELLKEYIMKKNLKQARKYSVYLIGVFHELTPLQRIDCRLALAEYMDMNIELV